MYTSHSRVVVPASVKQVSALILVYALVVLANTLYFALQTDFAETRELIRGLVRVAGMTGLAFWILTLQKSAWWFTMLSCGSLALLGGVGIAFLTVAVATGAIIEFSFVGILAVLIVPVFLLTVATLLLGSREVRQSFGVGGPRTQRIYSRARSGRTFR